MHYGLGIDAGETYTDAVIVRGTDGVVIDAKKSLERAGFTVDKHVILSELGMKKNKELDLNENEVNEIIAKVEEALKI